MPMRKWLIRNAAGLLSVLAVVQAVAQTGSAPAWQQAVAAFLRQHPSLQDREHQVQWPPTTAAWPRCTAPLEVRLEGREQAWGQVYLQLRCPADKGWSRQVSVYVYVKGQYLVARRDLRAGEALGPDDWSWSEGDLSRQGPQRVQTPQELEGRLLSRPLARGSPLKLNDFRPITVIRQGDQVQLSLVGRGFTVSTTGQALADAVAGGTVRVKTAEGKLLQGTAVSPGRVDVTLE